MLRQTDPTRTDAISDGGRPTRAVAWPAAAAVVAAVAIVAGGGFGHRALARHLDRAPDRVPIPEGTLAQLPLQIGEWVGNDKSIDQSIVRAADVDDYVNRQYVRRTDNQRVGLWVAYGVRARDLMPHRPEVCYPGAGWTLQGRETTVIPIADDVIVRARILSFTAGGFDSRRVTVLNYYIVDDQTCEDVSLLRSKAWRGQTAIRYMVQVQIACGANPARPVASPADIVREFAGESFTHIRGLLDKAVEPVGPAEGAD